MSTLKAVREDLNIVNPPPGFEVLDFRIVRDNWFLRTWAKFRASKALVTLGRIHFTTRIGITPSGKLVIAEQTLRVPFDTGFITNAPPQPIDQKDYNAFTHDFDGPISFWHDGESSLDMYNKKGLTISMRQTRHVGTDVGPEFSTVVGRYKLSLDKHAAIDLPFSEIESIYLKMVEMRAAPAVETGPAVS